MKEIEVYIPLQSNANVNEMMEWLEDQSIKLIHASPRHSDNVFGRAMIYGYAFFFTTEEDATAFKLRWL